MKPKRTVWMIAAVAGLALLALGLWRFRPDPPPHTPSDASRPSLFPETISEIQRVEVRWPRGKLVIRRGPEGWRLEEPRAHGADPEAVAAFLAELAAWKPVAKAGRPPTHAGPERQVRYLLELSGKPAVTIVVAEDASDPGQARAWKEGPPPPGCSPDARWSWKRWSTA